MLFRSCAILGAALLAAYALAVSLFPSEFGLLFDERLQLGRSRTRVVGGEVGADVFAYAAVQGLHLLAGGGQDRERIVIGVESQPPIGQGGNIIIVMEGNVGISGPPVIDVEIVVLAGGHVDRDARRHERNGAIPFVDAPEEFVSKVDVIQVVEAVGDIGLPQLPVQILGTPGRAVVLLVAFDGIVVYESRKCVPGGLGDLAVIDPEELVADDDAAAPE